MCQEEYDFEEVSGAGALDVEAGALASKILPTLKNVIKNFFFRISDALGGANNCFNMLTQYSRLIKMFLSEWINIWPGHSNKIHSVITYITDESIKRAKAYRMYKKECVQETNLKVKFSKKSLIFFKF